MSEATQMLLNRAGRGDPPAAAELLPLVYEELRRLAAQKMARESQPQTLQPTALVHEAWLRLLGNNGDNEFANRAHFFAAAAEAMRRILIDRARRKKAARHGGELVRTEFDSINAPHIEHGKPEELLALDEALSELACEAPRKARIVEFRYFVGLSVEEVADILDISTPTVKRDWAFARAWLHRAVSDKLKEP